MCIRQNEMQQYAKAGHKQCLSQQKACRTSLLVGSREIWRLVFKRSATPQMTFHLMLCEPWQMGAMGALLDLQLGALTGHPLKQQVPDAVHVHLPGRRKLNQQRCCCRLVVSHSMPALLDVGS